MHLSERFIPFLKLAAICSILGAVTTALLIFLPNPTAPDFESRALLYDNDLHISRIWILFVHPQVNFIASLGVALILWKKYPLQMMLGIVFLAMWAYTEISQQALLIDALNLTWRPGYVSAADEETQSTFRTLIQAASGLSASKYFIVIYGFGIGSLLYGLALIREVDWAKWIGWALVFIGVLSLASFSRYYLGFSFLNGIVNWSYEWIYSYLQPLVRVALGWWIWSVIRKL